MSKLAVLASVVAGLVAVPAASASQPVFTPPPTSVPDFTDTACGFPINVHTVVNGEVAKTFSDGRIVITGPLVWEASANGKTVTLNIPGPATIVVAADGSATFAGRGVGAGDFLTPDGVRFLEVAGRVTFPLDGSVPPVQGHVLLDLCAALAP
jgi:hypothetical protein